MVKGLLTNVIVAVLFTACVITFGGCGGGGGGGSSSGSSGGPTPQATGTVGNTGGTIAVTNTNSSIVGAKIVVPSNALDTSENATLSVSFSDELPAPFTAVSATGITTTIVSKTIIINNSSSDKFKVPVSITIPYNDAQLDAGDIPVVFYWDTTYNKYIPVGIKSIDRVNKTITISTVHCSSFLAVAIKGIKALATSLLNVDSGYRPETDGFFHPNFGAYDSPGGCCFGMSNYSIWYYWLKKASDGTALYSKYKQGDIARWTDDVIVRELISRAFMTSEQAWAFKCIEYQSLIPTDIDTALLLISSMKMTGAPQDLDFIGVDGSGNAFGHAVTVFKYDADLGKFYIYDNNFPGETVTLDWTLSGLTFTNYTKAACYGTITKYSFDAFSSAFNAGDYETLYQGAKDGWTNSKFQTINITSPTITANNTATITSTNNVLIEGTVTGGLAAAKYLVYKINGNNATFAGSSYLTLGAGGTFSFTIPSLPYSSNSIMFMTTDDVNDATRGTPNAYAGFKEITIKLQGENFFTNLGFETGDWTAWTHETHTWSNTTPGSYTPEKSGIESSDFDPIGTTIPKVYIGNYSARVNNYDDSYHISSISQAATVPATANPQLTFYWAAVLEDPQHDAANQPYIDIVVTDDTAATTLYSKHFYTNDPSYSGWISFSGGQWKVIPWQIVTINTTGTQGHQVTIKVTAADCGYGAHGGYVYVDGEE